MLPLPYDSTESPDARCTVLPPRPAAADTHSSSLIEHQLLDRTDDGGSGRGHGSSQWRPHYRAPSRGPGRDSFRVPPGDREDSARRPSTPDPPDDDNVGTLNPQETAAARCFRIPRAPPPNRPGPDARGGATRSRRR